MGKGTTTSGVFVARTGCKRELQFVLKSQSEICGGESLGRTRARSRNLNVECTSMEGKESGSGLKGGNKKVLKNMAYRSCQVKKMKRGLVYAKRRMKTTISDLPQDLVSDILSRVPMTSLGSVRSTCKKWKALSRNWIFGKVAEAKNLFLGFMLMDSMIFSLRLDFQGIRYYADHFTDISIKQVSSLNQYKVSKAYHCDGLLLFSILDEYSRLLVWNPYLGQTRWIQYTYKPSSSFALGYDNIRNHKILEISEFGYSIYEFSSNSWRVFDVNRSWQLSYRPQSVNLKGNTFFFAKEKGLLQCYLLSFDFTSEKFGPLLSLPPHHNSFHIALTLSCVRDEKLAVLIQNLFVLDTPEIMEFWITNKMDCNEVSWTKWMQVDVVRGPFLSSLRPFFESFVIDEEKKIAVVFDRAHCDEGCLYQKSHMSEEYGHYCLYSFGFDKLPKLCSSYVPSLVQIE